MGGGGAGAELEPAGDVPLALSLAKQREEFQLGVGQVGQRAPSKRLRPGPWAAWVTALLPAQFGST